MTELLPLEVYPFTLNECVACGFTLKDHGTGRKAGAHTMLADQYRLSGIIERVGQKTLFLVFINDLQMIQRHVESTLNPC